MLDMSRWLEDVAAGGLYIHQIITKLLWKGVGFFMEKFMKFIESVLNKYHKIHHNLSYLSLFIDGVGNKKENNV